MKAKTFENLIRKVVREEIDYALRREIKSLKEDLQNEIKPKIVEQNNSSLKDNIMGKKPIKKNFKPKSFTNNSTLNDLLNETAMGDTNLNGNSSPAYINGDFSTIGGVPAEAAPKEVVDAVTRDYSGLMKAINKRNNK